MKFFMKILLFVCGAFFLTTIDVEARRHRGRRSWGWGYYPAVVAPVGLIGTAAIVNANERANRAEAAAAQARADKAWAEKSEKEKSEKKEQLARERILLQLNKLYAKQASFEVEIDRLDNDSSGKNTSKALDRLHKKLRQVKDAIEKLEQQLR